MIFASSTGEKNVQEFILENWARFLDDLNTIG